MQISSTTPAGPKPLAVKVLAVALGSATLIMVAPLIVLTVMAAWADRKLHSRSPRDRRRSWFATILYPSSLAELPLLVADVWGGGSPLAAAPPLGSGRALAGASPARLLSVKLLPGVRVMVPISGAMQDLGSNFRHAFITMATTEFDGILRAVDRASSALTTEFEGIPDRA